MFPKGLFFLPFVFPFFLILPSLTLFISFFLQAEISLLNASMREWGCWPGGRLPCYLGGTLRRPPDPERDIRSHKGLPDQTAAVGFHCARSPSQTPGP